ncbi:MAG: branched-chain amino acid ABC transporter permease [Desulfovibrio sp.]|jgi:branched-chain amino acid transport system permease protein|nr:branched-chain amino acid ABC transporter permease [Desulfovibrio sp.]
MNETVFFRRHFSLAAGCVFFAVMACVPALLDFAGAARGGIAQLDILNKIGIYAALALSLNIVLGQAGMFHMGHTAFFAVGAYATAILNTLYKWPVFATMPVAGLFAAAFAFLVAIPIIHLRGDYLLIVTIGIVEIVGIALKNNIFGLTGGANGIYGIARPELFGLVFSTPKLQYGLIWGFTALSAGLFYLLEHSRFGRALNYIRYDDLAASGCGINVARHKLAAFTLGAFWAGMTGTLFAANIRTIEPTSFNFYESVILFAIVILGGSGSIAGVLFGSFLLIGLQDVFRGFENARMLVFGAAMMLMMIFRPQGLLPPRRRHYDAHAFMGKFPSALTPLPQSGLPTSMLSSAVLEDSPAAEARSKTATGNANFGASCPS